MSFEGRQILPGNASPLEQIWADLKWDRAAGIDVDVIRSLVDPATCPVELLAWLAWSFSVDVWNKDWPDGTKRAVIAAAPEVHRLRGTRRAVRLGLAALGATFDIVEWWETEEPRRRGTFKVTVWATGEGPTLDVAFIEQLRHAVRRTKPKSRVAELLIGARLAGDVHVGGIVRSIMHTKIEAEGSPNFRSVFVGGVLQSAVHIKIQPEDA